MHMGGLAPIPPSRPFITGGRPAARHAAGLSARPAGSNRCAPRSRSSRASRGGSRRRAFLGRAPVARLPRPRAPFRPPPPGSGPRWLALARILDRPLRPLTGEPPRRAVPPPQVPPSGLPPPWHPPFKESPEGGTSSPPAAMRLRRVERRPPGRGDGPEPRTPVRPSGAGRSAPPGAVVGSSLSLASLSPPPALRCVALLAALRPAFQAHALPSAPSRGLPRNNHYAAGFSRS